MLPVLLLTLALMLLGFAGLGIRMLVLKQGEFRGTCSSHNPLLAEKGVDCATCPSRYKGECASSHK
ncbi:MAG: membrane or secreted protein [Bacteroidia bacterium]